MNAASVAIINWIENPLVRLRESLNFPIVDLYSQDNLGSLPLGPKRVIL